MPCEICHHPDRHDIEIKLQQRASASALARIYAVAAKAVTLHSRAHMDNLPVPVKANLLDCMKDLADAHTMITLRMQSLSEQGTLGAHVTFAALAREQRANIETRIKIARDMRPELTNWPKLRDRILRALEPFPEAQTAVAEAIEEQDE